MKALCAEALFHGWLAGIKQRDWIQIGQWNYKLYRLLLLL